jgi:hypothetical protein
MMKNNYNMLGRKVFGSIVGNWTFNLLVLSMFVFAGRNTVAQPVYDWAHPLSVQIEYSTSVMTTDSSGNLYIAGAFSGTVDFDPGPGTTNLTATGDDGFIAKFDHQGHLIWAKQIAGNGYAIPWSITVDDAQNVYIAGYYSDTYDFDPSAATANLTSVSSSYDIFFAKYDNSGNYRWAHSIGDIRTDVAHCIAISPLGDVFIAGIFHGTMDFDPSAGGTATLSTGAEDMFIAKYDTAGNYSWAIQIGGSSRNDPRSLAFDNNNNVIVNGFFDSTTDFDPSVAVANLTAGGRLDAFLAKYDNNGNYVWALNPTGSGDQDYTYQVVVDDENNIYMCGRLEGIVDFDFSAGTTNLTSNGMYDIFLVKYDASGSLVWAKSTGNASSHEVGFGLAIDNNQNLVMSGYFEGKVDFDFGTAPGDTAYLTPQGNSDMYLASYDRDGNYLWAVDIGGGGASVSSRSLIIDRFNNAFSAGSITGTADFDPGTGVGNASGGRKDIYFAKYYLCSSDTVKVDEHICGGTTYTFGSQSLTTAGTYTEVFSSAACGDSIVTLTLAVTDVDTSISTAGNVLSANASGSTITYQWIECGVGPVAGANTKLFTPTKDGDYAVVVTNGSCVDTSSCHTVVGTGVSELYGKTALSVYPNPANTMLMIKTDLPTEMTMTNSLGKAVHKSVLKKGTNQINIEAFSPGVYFITTNQGAYTKLIVQ